MLMLMLAEDCILAMHCVHWLGNLIQMYNCRRLQVAGVSHMLSWCTSTRLALGHDCHYRRCGGALLCASRCPVLLAPCTSKRAHGARAAGAHRVHTHTGVHQPYICLFMADG